MKRLYANRPGWKRILRQRFRQACLDTPEFSGTVTLLCLDAVREPLTRLFHGRPVTLADSGYTWLQHFPTGAHYTMTTMFDTHGQVVQWYIDICLETGLDGGIPWLVDLYLDIVITPAGEVELLDAHELDVALTDGQVDQAAYDLAWHSANDLLGRIGRGEFGLPGLSASHRSLLLEGE